MSLDDLVNDDDGGGGEEGAPAWMATFSDMATLLLTFFILLLSFANMDIENFKVALGSVREAFGVQTEAQGDYEAMSTSPIELSTEISAAELLQQQQLDEFNQVKEYIKKKNLDKSVRVINDPRGIILRINDIVLFDTGSDKLTPEADGVLDVVGKLASLSSGQLAIEGHTDDRPISTSRFPSNWELSAARSTAVLRYLTGLHALDAKRVYIAGYADSRPVADNHTEEGRAKNRRVEFVFIRPRSAEGKPQRIFRLPFSEAQ